MNNGGSFSGALRLPLVMAGSGILVHLLGVLWPAVLMEILGLLWGSWQSGGRVWQGAAASPAGHSIYSRGLGTCRRSLIDRNIWQPRASFHQSKHSCHQRNQSLPPNHSVGAGILCPISDSCERTAWSCHGNQEVAAAVELQRRRGRRRGDMRREQRRRLSAMCLLLLVAFLILR